MKIDTLGQHSFLIVITKKVRLGKIAPAEKSEFAKSSFIITIPEKVGLGKSG